MNTPTPSVGAYAPRPYPIALAYIFTPGCHACAAAKPEWNKVKPKLAQLGIEIYETDLTATEFPPLGWRQWTPQATPSLLLRIGSWAGVIEGAQTAATIEAWVRAKLREHGVSA